jgi:hypothetical protein
VLQLNKGGQEEVVHHNKLKRYEGKNPEAPKWAARASKKI